MKMVRLNCKKAEHKRKGETNMAAFAKPNEANMIREGMLAAFAQEVKKSIPNKEYWDECRRSKTMFSPEDVVNMKNMCKGQKK